jgi:hypothetical protein
MRIPFIPPPPPPPEEPPTAEPFSIPGGADPDDHWFPPILQNVSRTFRIHQEQQKGF